MRQRARPDLWEPREGDLPGPPDWITERLRVGELERERVELAAYCGHEATCRLLGRPTPEPSRCCAGWGVHGEAASAVVGS